MQTDVKINGNQMKTLLFTTLLFATLSLPAFADPNPRAGDHPNANAFKGAPGPLLAAGLPALVVGAGIYWLVRRRKRTD